MMFECITGELLARGAFMHYDDRGHDALRHDAVLKCYRVKTDPFLVAVAAPDALDEAVLVTLEEGAEGVTQIELLQLVQVHQRPQVLPVFFFV